MNCLPTSVEGAFLIEPSVLSDERGFFLRAFCAQTFAEFGLETDFVQSNLAGSVHRGTLRGMHYQVAPYEEAKLVRCVRGSIYDVVLDLRPASATLGQWFGSELSSENRKMLYVPPGCAHGYLTLASNTEVYYLVSAPYSPQSERGVRWDDPKFSIEWPQTSGLTLSDKDRAWPDFSTPG